MSKYGLTKVTIFVFLFFYALIGIVTNTRVSEQLIFPIASWDLFSQIPNTVTTFAIRLPSLHKKNDLLQENSKFLKNRYSVTTNEVIQQLGNAYIMQDQEKQKFYTKILEKNYMKKNVTYQLIKIQFNPLERYKNKEYTLLSIILTKQL